jgi:hypothetical protein
MAALVALRAQVLGLALNPRLFAVMAVLAGGAALSAFVMRLVGVPLLRRLAPWARIPVLAALLGGATIMCAGVIFSIIIRDLMPGEPPVEDPESDILGRLLAHGSAAYLMLLAGWSLMLPWVVPVHSLVCAVAMAGRTSEAR